MTVRATWFYVSLLAVTAIIFLATHLVGNDYAYFAGYVILQYVVLATAWNILAGYTGYINFGTAAFMAVGTYSTIVISKLTSLPLPLLVVIGGLMSGILGLLTGYMTMRFKGIFFSIATLALAIVLQTLVVNWSYVGGSRGAYVLRPTSIAFFQNYAQYLFALMLVLAMFAVSVARAIGRSTIGVGLATIRDDETAAEACGVPTFKLKLFATAVSGALMGMAGAPLPYYLTYVEPTSAFSLSYTVNSIAMPIIGGMASWPGPVIGAVLLGSIQQLATVTISSSLNLLVVGVLLLIFVTVAPNGILGLISSLRKRAGQ